MYSPWLRRRADHCFKCKLEQLNALRMSSAVILLVYAVMHSLCCWCELTVNYSGPCWDTTHVKPDFSFISSTWRKCWSYRMLELVVLQAPPQGCLSQVKVQLMRFIWLPEKEYIYIKFLKVFQEHRYKMSPDGRILITNWSLLTFWVYTPTSVSSGKCCLLTNHAKQQTMNGK